MTRGEKLKQLRKKSGLTQLDIAKQAGVALQTIFKYEKDIITNIPTDTIEKLARLFNVPPGYLLGWTELEQSKKNDILSDIIIRLRTDEKLLETVSILYNLPNELLDMVLDFLNTPFFQKEPKNNDE